MNRRISKTFDEVCKDIIEKKSVDYVGAYELIKHEKLKMKCFNDANAQNGRLTTNQVSPDKFFSIENPNSWHTT